MECCGRERTTAFCSDCGQNLSGDAKQEVITFLTGKRNQLLGTQLKIKKWAEVNPDSAESSRYHRLRKVRLQRQIERFSGWIDALDKLVEPNERKV